MSDLALTQPVPLAIARGNGKRSLRIVQSLCILVIALVMISPLFMLLIASLKDDRFRILADMGSFRAFWVSDPTLSNYKEIAHFSGELAYGRYLFNSLVILGATVVSGLVVNSMAGFVLAWGSLRGKAALLALVVALYVIPQESIIMPLVVMMSRAGLTDTFAVQILPWVASPLYVFLFYQFFAQLPKELYEARKWTARRPSASTGRSTCLSACRRSPRSRSSWASKAGTSISGRRWSPRPTMLGRLPSPSPPSSDRTASTGTAPWPPRC